MVLRKKDITAFYQKRDDLTVDDARLMICNPQILSSIDEKFRDGLKLCAYLVLEKLEAEPTWKAIRSFVVTGDPNPKVCNKIGSVLRKAYKDALDTNSGMGIVTRSDVAEQIFRPLMQHCVLVKRTHSEKFCEILRGAVEDRDHDLSKMLFDMSMPIVWRYLKAKNAHIRQAAYFVQACVYPPISDDPILATDYANRHYEAFINALRDPSLDICLQAIEFTCAILSMWCGDIPENNLEEIFKELADLAEDESAEIRASVYHGLRHFRDCARGFKTFEELLKRICPKGIDDMSEKARCNCFRLLNYIDQTKIKILALPKNQNADVLLSLESILYRLDFEQSEAVEREICLLIFKALFNREMSNETRYKTLNQMCRLNRNACLDFHRLLYTVRADNEGGVLTHVLGILTIADRVLKTIVQKIGDASDETNSAEERSGGNDETSVTVTNETTSSNSLEQQIKRLKDIIDCAVVCYSTMRYDPSFKNTSGQPQLLESKLAEISTLIVSNLEQNVGLLDTAFSIITLVRSAGVNSAAIRIKTKHMLCSGHINGRYLEVFGLIDMNELLALIQKGLEQLENSISNTENVTKKRKPVRVKVDGFIEPKVSVEALHILIASPSCGQYIIEHYEHFLDNFAARFERICDTFMQLMRQDKSIDMQLFTDCCEVWTVLSIIRYNRSAIIEKNAEEKQSKSTVRKRPQTANPRRSAIILANIESAGKTDPLLDLCHWIEYHLDAEPDLNTNADLVELFYRILGLHIRGYKHMETTFERAIELIEKLHKTKEDRARTRSINVPYQACLAAAEKAMEFAIPRTVPLPDATMDDEMPEESAQQIEMPQQEPEQQIEAPQQQKPEQQTETEPQQEVDEQMEAEPQPDNLHATAEQALELSSPY